MSIDDLKATANLIRAKIKDIDDDVKALKDNLVMCKATMSQEQKLNADFGESIAQTMLAHRHLEDARHRLSDTIDVLGGNEKTEQQQA